MNKLDWQKYYGFSDSDMLLIEEVLEMFNGKIVAVQEEDIR
jgi:hypothetical protein